MRTRTYIATFVTPITWDVCIWGDQKTVQQKVHAMTKNTGRTFREDKSIGNPVGTFQWNQTKLQKLKVGR